MTNLILKKEKFDPQLHSGFRALCVEPSVMRDAADTILPNCVFLEDNSVPIGWAFEVKVDHPSADYVVNILIKESERGKGFSDKLLEELKVSSKHVLLTTTRNEYFSIYTRNRYKSKYGMKTLDDVPPKDWEPLHDLFTSATKQY
jgi:hypothetical protein